MTIVTRASKGSALTWAEMDSNWTEFDRRTTAGYGSIPAAIDTTGAGIISPPTKTLYLGVVQLNSFDPDTPQQFTLNWLMPNDYIAGTTIYPRAIFISSTGAVGTVRFGFVISYADEYDPTLTPGNPAANQKFSTPFSGAIELPFTAAMQDACYHSVLPGGLPLPLNPRSAVIANGYRDATHINDTFPDPIYLLAIDIAYQAQTFGEANP